MSYDVGDKVKITGSFTNNGAASDPAAVIAWYTSPGGTVTTLTYGTDAGLTKVSTGVYSFYMAFNRSGRWYYRMDDNDQNVAAEGFLDVNTSRFK